jgi:hypothetical protein
MFDVNRGDTGDQTIAPLRAAWIDRETKRVIIDASFIAPQSDAYAATARTPVPPPAPPVTSTDEEIARERQLDARDRSRDERTVRSDEVVVDRRLADADEPLRLADADEPLPPPDGPRIERRDYDDYPDQPA